MGLISASSFSNRPKAWIQRLGVELISNYLSLQNMMRILPKEVLLQIFSHLPRSGLIEISTILVERMVGDCSQTGVR